MSDKIVLTIDVTPEEHRRIVDLAERLGFNTPGEYLLSLVEPAEPEDDEETKEQILEEIRQGLQAAMRGETIPASELWDALNSDD